MGKEWRPLGGNKFIRFNEDGTVTGRRIENEKAINDAHAAMRRETSRSKSALRATAAKGCGLRYIGGMSRLLFTQMRAECGMDPDKQMAFRRDHADEILAVPKNSAGLPKKRTYSFPGQKRRS